MRERFWLKHSRLYISLSDISQVDLYVYELSPYTHHLFIKYKHGGSIKLYLSNYQEVEEAKDVLTYLGMSRINKMLDNWVEAHKDDDWFNSELMSILAKQPY